MAKSALIVGAGSGISAAFARRLHREGYKILLASRSVGDLDGLCRETGASSQECDASDPTGVSELFARVDQDFDGLDVALYNAGSRISGPLIDLDHEKVRNTLLVGAFGGFLVAQEAARRMLNKGSGTILLTGASASVKGYARSAPFAMAKFALRGLAQSMARELHPQGVHVAHFVIDGVVRNEATGRDEPAGGPGCTLLDPDAIAEVYMQVVDQPRSVWTWEVELRPWVEKF